MSDDVAIEVENLGKLYYLGGQRPRARRIMGRLRAGLTGVAPADENERAVQEGRAFWALRDLSFSVKRGEVLGLIGRNGAGKSTLLKILSRITEPTTGRALVRGRVMSLLEVGTGFHDELTGRENIYLNAAILGMRNDEIARSFDQIVAFSGVERFLDTPVKYYSSGMRVRLGFSVAAHVPSDVLIIDEVLAVGDLAFQEKCLKRVDAITRDESRTVLFVSHSMGAIANLCPQSIMLQDGRIVARGPSGQIINSYHDATHSDGGRQSLRERRDRTGSGVVRFVGFFMSGEDGEPVKYVKSGAAGMLVLEYEALPGFDKLADVLVNVVVSNNKGQRLFGLPSDVVGPTSAPLRRRGRFACHVPSLPLLPGTYELDIACLVNRELADKVMGAASITVIDGDFFGTGRLPSSYYGDLLSLYDWTFNAPEAGATSIAPMSPPHSPRERAG
jgi:lipopolysaccharide transport system ATP-binding protein